MKSIDFLFVGASKNASFAILEKEYGAKIQRYVDSHFFYVKDGTSAITALRKKEETQNLLKKIALRDILVLCDERGRSLTSLQLAKKISEWQVAGQRVVGVVGGAYGVSDELLAQARFVLKLSDFTLPHELARVVFLEQMYRGLTILKGEKYHH